MLRFVMDKWKRVIRWVSLKEENALIKSVSGCVWLAFMFNVRLMLVAWKNLHIAWIYIREHKRTWDLHERTASNVMASFFDVSAVDLVGFDCDSALWWRILLGIDDLPKASLSLAYAYELAFSFEFCHHAADGTRWGMQGVCKRVDG